jgi:hypothetical protein
MKRSDRRHTEDRHIDSPPPEGQTRHNCTRRKINDGGGGRGEEGWRAIEAET